MSDVRRLDLRADDMLLGHVVIRTVVVQIILDLAHCKEYISYIFTLC